MISINTHNNINFTDNNTTTSIITTSTNTNTTTIYINETVH